MDNYEISRDRAQAFFLGFDQEDLIRRLALEHDEAWLYVRFIGQCYRICRATGAVERHGDGSAAGFEEVLSIFDFLCHQGTEKTLSGVWAPVNSLKGLPKTIGVETGFFDRLSALFDRNPDAFRAACLALGGERVDMGDIGFRFPVFRDFSVILKFYRSDDEFPASTTILWDENTLQFIYYETAFYVAGHLLRTIAAAIPPCGKP